MEFSFYHGRDKIPFTVVESGVYSSNLGTPIHGIASLGMLSKCLEQNISADQWTSNAHLLHDVQEKNEDSPLLRDLRNLANECAVLSFSQSAICAQRYADKLLESSSIKDIQGCELWNIKEGAISSVWKVDVVGTYEHQNFVINIARDKAAGTALLKGARRMKKVMDKAPQTHGARVLQISEINGNNLPSPVVVTQNEWIDRAYEVHTRKNRLNGKQEFLIIDRFLMDELQPARIEKVIGRILNHNERRILLNDIKQFKHDASASLSRPPIVDINRGDVVFNGRAYVVAIA